MCRLVQEFRELKKWRYARDHNGTQIVTEDAVMSGHVQMGWISTEYHMIHCLYSWKKLSRQLERGGAMDLYILRSIHTNHCAMMLEMQLKEVADMDAWGAFFIVQYPQCAVWKNKA